MIKSTMKNDDDKNDDNGINDTTVDATVQLIHSIENLTLASHPSSDSHHHHHHHPQEELLSLSSALPLARRIMSSSIGSYHHHGQEKTDIPYLLKKLERSYSSYRKSLLNTSHSSSSTKIEMDVPKVMTKIKSLHRRLIALELHCNDDDNAAAAASGGGIARQGKILELLTALVGSARDGHDLTMMVNTPLPSSSSSMHGGGMYGGSMHGGGSIHGGGMYSGSMHGRRGNFEQQQQQPQPFSSSTSAAASKSTANTTGSKTKKSKLAQQNQNEMRTTRSKPPMQSSPPYAHMNNNPLSEEEHKKQLTALPHEELTLLRECILSLQGINGEFLRFYKPPSETTANLEGIHIATHPNSILPLSIKENLDIRGVYTTSSLLSGGTTSTLDAIKICAECGWLYYRIQSYINCILYQNSDREDVGAVSRAFASALHSELNEYLRLVAILESQVNSSPEEEEEKGGEKLTLRKLMLHLRTPLSRLRTLAMVTDGILSYNTQTKQYYPILTGGKLVQALHTHSKNSGDTRHQSLLQSLTYASATPWYDALFEWTTQGRLILKNGNFFIKKEEKVEIQHLWHGRYVLRKDCIPYSIMEESMARRVLVLGKGINFVRKCLGDVDWAPYLSGQGVGGGDGDGDGRSGRSGGTGFFGSGGNSHSQFGRGGFYGKNNEEIDETYQDAETRRNTQKISLGYHYDPSSSFLPTSSQTSTTTSTTGGRTRLHQTITHLSTQVHSHILTSLLSKPHHLLQHLYALKQFLLLGQGDFVTAFMGLCFREFDVRLHGSTTGLYFHTMMGVLENAIRSTNARFLPNFVLERLLVELNYGEEDGGDGSDGGGRYAMGSPPSVIGGDGKKDADDGNDDDNDDFLSDDEEDENDPNKKKKKDGWDIFSLTYNIDAPLTAVVHPHAMEQYKRIFTLLFRLKRIEWMLNRTWRHGTALNHAMHAAVRRGDTIGSFGDDDEDGSGRNHWRDAAALLRRVSMTTQSMLHFTTNLQSYFMFEVLEGGWKALVRKIKRASTLDEVIEAHDAYLEEIVGKSLLGKETTSDDEDNDDEEEGKSPKNNVPSLAKQLQTVLDITLKFCKLQGKMFRDALNSIDKAARKRRRAERRTKAGRWGYTEKDDDDDATDLYNATFRRLSNAKRKQQVESISIKFDVALKGLLDTLNRRINEPSSHANSYATLGNISSPLPHHQQLQQNRNDGNAVRGQQQLQQQQYLENHESLRFLTFRLDFSEYYAKQS